MWQVAICGSSGLLGDGLAHLLEGSGYRVVDRADVEASVDIPNESVDLVLVEGLSSRTEIVDNLSSISRRFPSARIILLIQPGADLELLQMALLNGAQGCVEKTASFAAMLAAVDAVLHGQIVCPSMMRNWLLPRTAQAPARGAMPSQIAELPRLRDAEGRPKEKDVPVGPSTVAPIGGAVGLELERPRQNTSDRPRPDPWNRQAGPAPQRQVREEAPSVSLSSRETEILRYLTRGDANKVIARQLDISEATVKSHLKSLLRKLNFNNRTQAAIWAINNGKFSEHIQVKG